MSSVFSIEPDGITRAWQTVPLINRNAKTTHSQPKASRWRRFVFGSAVTSFLRSSDLTGYLNQRVGIALAGPNFWQYTLNQNRYESRMARRKLRLSFLRPFRAPQVVSSTAT